MIAPHTITASGGLEITVHRDEATTIVALKGRGEAREWLLSSESDAAFASVGINPDLIRVHIM